MAVGIFFAVVSFGLAFMVYALVQFLREGRRTSRMHRPRRNSMLVALLSFLTVATDRQASAADQQIPPAIAKELEAMKQRIEQLEAQLKKEPRTTAVTTAKATAPVAAAPLAEAAKPAKAEPFAFADFTWLNGNARTKQVPLDTKFFTPEIRADIDYIYDFNHPADDTIGDRFCLYRFRSMERTVWSARAL